MKSARSGDARRDKKMTRRKDQTSTQRQTLKRQANAKRRRRDKGEN
jgi:hypothetical protein